MPRSAAGNVAICTIVDAATGFVIVAACPDKTHAGVINALRCQVFPHYGCPKVLVSDKGKENVNSEVAKFLSGYHIEHRLSSTGHPQSNGLVERRQRMILSFFRKLIDSPKTQQVWDEALPDFQTVINSTTSKSREHSPFFLTFFRHPNFPFASLTSSKPSLSEASTVAARLNFSAQILAQAAEHAKQMHACSKEQFDKHVHARRFPVGAKVFVSTSDRAGLSKKLAKPFKGPFVCVANKQNDTIRLVPIAGGRPISTHVNNCKLAPYREQHLLFSEPDSQGKANDSDTHSDPNIFRYSNHDSSPSLLEDDSPNSRDELAEPNAPPDEDDPAEEPLPPSPPAPEVVAGPSPDPTPGTSQGGARPRVPTPSSSESSGSGYRQNEPAGPPRTRTAAREPGKALPPLPGLGHDKLPLERWLNKKKRQLQGKTSDKTKD